MRPSTLGGNTSGNIFLAVTFFFKRKKTLLNSFLSFFISSFKTHLQLSYTHTYRDIKKIKPEKNVWKITGIPSCLAILLVYWPQLLQHLNNKSKHEKPSTQHSAQCVKVEYVYTTLWMQLHKCVERERRKVDFVLIGYTWIVACCC